MFSPKKTAPVESVFDAAIKALTGQIELCETERKSLLLMGMKSSVPQTLKTVEADILVKKARLATLYKMQNNEPISKDEHNQLMKLHEARINLDIRHYFRVVEPMQCRIM